MIKDNNGRDTRTRNDLRTREVGPERNRLIPLGSINITATTAGTSQTLFAMGSFITEVGKVTVTNTSGSSATLSVHMVPSGSVIGDANKEIDALTVPANYTLRIDGLLGGMYAPSGSLEVYSGTSGALNIRGHVKEWR